MKVNELRIGNWCIYMGEVNSNVIIDSYLDLKPVSEFPDSFKGIPLTEEWLIKFGFTEAMFDYTIHTGEFYNGSIGLLSIAGNNRKFQLQYEMKCTQTTIQYVHQLQNLYFALTQTELIIKHE